MTQSPPPGWHPDPANPAIERWWDGNAWTSNTRPRSLLTPQTANQPGKKKRRWPWVVGGVVAFMIIVANLPGGTKSNETSTERSNLADNSSEAASRQEVAAAAPEDASKAAVDEPSIGDPVRDGKFEFVVHSWNGETASITITNIGDRPNSVSTTSQYLIDTQDRRFEPEFEWSSDLAYADLNPGQSVTGELSYILSGATPRYLELHDSMFSGGVLVRIN